MNEHVPIALFLAAIAVLSFMAGRHVGRAFARLRLPNQAAADAVGTILAHVLLFSCVATGFAGWIFGVNASWYTVVVASLAIFSSVVGGYAGYKQRGR